MEERSSGIIVRTRPLTETSLIVHWLTHDLGRIHTVAKGARRAKSPFLGKLDLFYEADFSFARSRRSELHNLREVIVLDTHARLREEIGWLRQASYFALLLEKSTEPESPVPELHHLMRSALMAMPKARPTGVTVLVFELNMLCLLGYAPDLKGLSTVIQQRIEQAISLDFEQALTVLASLDIASKRELNRFLESKIASVIDRVLPQREGAVNVARTANPLPS